MGYKSTVEIDREQAIEMMVSLTINEMSISYRNIINNWTDATLENALEEWLDKIAEKEGSVNFNNYSIVTGKDN